MNLQKVRIKYKKGYELRFISHLNLIKMVLRIFRRAELAVMFSSGFSPRPRVSFGPPLSLGMYGSSEYMDVVLNQRVSVNDIKQSLNSRSPHGFEVLDVREIFPGSRSLSEIIDLAEYKISLNGNTESCFERIRDFLGQDKILIERDNGKRKKVIDIRKNVMDMKINFKGKESFLVLSLKLDEKNYVKVDYILDFMLKDRDKDSDLHIERTGLFISLPNGLATPTEIKY